MAAKAIRKMQVPAYCPVELGIQDMEYRGVVVEVKNVMAMEFMPIIVVSDEELAVDVAMDMSAMVLVAAAVIDIVMPAIDMPSILI